MLLDELPVSFNENVPKPVIYSPSRERERERTKKARQYEIATIRFSFLRVLTSPRLSIRATTNYDPET